MGFAKLRGVEKVFPEAMPSTDRTATPSRIAAVCVSLIAALVPMGCPAGNTGGGATPGAVSVPKPTDPTYRDAVSAFFSGTIALDTENKDQREEMLKRATELAPGEPAAWANLALAYVVNANVKDAQAAIQKAHQLAPDSPEVALAEGFVARAQGNFSEAVKQFRRAAEKDPNNLKVLWLIAEVADQQRGADSDATRTEMYGRILATRPENVPALMEATRLAAQTKDSAKVTGYVATLMGQTAGFSERAKTLMAALKAAADAGDFRKVGSTSAMLRNSLSSTPAFKASLNEVSFRSPVIGDPVGRLLVMQNPPSTPAAPDTGLTYAVAPVMGAESANLTLAVPLEITQTPTLLTGSGGNLQVGTQSGNHLALPFGPPSAAIPPLTQANFLMADLNSDFLTDITWVGSGGLRLYRQGTGGAFTDVTAAAKIPPAITSAKYLGGWAVDIEADGDLDMVLCPWSGKLVVLQNNGDDTFTPIPSPFADVPTPVTGFAWGDIDGDGDADPIFLSEGKLTVYANERSGIFRKREPLTLTGKVTALTLGDTNGDATLEILALLEDGSVVSVAGVGTKTPYGEPITLVKSGITQGNGLTLADLDNNGGLDLIVSGSDKSEVYLSDADKKFTGAAIPLAFRVQGVADLTGDGLLDLVGIHSGKSARAVATSTKKYGYQSFTLKAKHTTKADDRINTFGIGGEVEMRAGLLYAKQPINGPQIHFGLGDYKKVDVLRVTWPTGNAQSEFDQPTGPVVAEQRLGGSCPFLYAWNGKEMGFVTDCIWRSPLGLKINAQATAGVNQTEDWVKVRGDQLVPQDGSYRLSITGELRETHFFDTVQLMAVDHPADTDIWVDERFVPTAPPLLEVIQTRTPQPFARITGFEGQDASAIVAERDGTYLDDFGRGQYQGVTQDHWVTLELPSTAPMGVPLYLIAHGWLHPTDSSINVALGQNKGAGPPRGLSLEVEGADGKWVTARPGLGFPEGKVKTIVLRLDDAFKKGAPRRVRLRTNLEIFWDQLRWAEGVPKADKRAQRLIADSASLRYRGFSQVAAKDASSPEIPVRYDERYGVTPRWRDLEGYCTRYGDVLPLLGKVDDRYVILNAGDELQLTFPELPPPPSGWQRDFVVIGDGWCKDGNINTTWGRTVMPYPEHARRDYPTAPGALEDDPTYRHHPDDWTTYHTRYVTGDPFRTALLP